MSRADRGNGRKGSPVFRWVAAGSAAVFLMTSAYQVSWGQGAGGNHNPGPVNNNDDEGLDASEQALIATGAAVAGGLLYVFVFRRKRHHDEDDGKVQRSLPEGKKVGALRLVPTSDSVQAGDVDVFDLQARDDSGNWVSVNDRDGASISVDGDSPLVLQDGAKNAFCLPISTPSSFDGKSVTLVGNYRQDDGTQLTTRSRVMLHVGQFAAAQ